MAHADPQSQAAEKNVSGSAARNTATTGKGIPDKQPQASQDDAERDGPRRGQTARDTSVETSLQMPHERDQSTDMTTDKQSPLVQQAHEDVSRGLQDTTKQPEMNTAYKKQK